MAATVAITIDAVRNVEAGETTPCEGAELVVGIEAEVAPGKPLQLDVSSFRR